jgi:hypothetical protein
MLGLDVAAEHAQSTVAGWTFEHGHPNDSIE